MKKSILMIVCTTIMGAAIAQTKPATTASTAKQSVRQTVVANDQQKKAKTQRTVAYKQKRQALNSIKNDKGKPAAASHDLAVAKKDYRKDQNVRAKDRAALKRDAKKKQPTTNPQQPNSTTSDN